MGDGCASRVQAASVSRPPPPPPATFCLLTFVGYVACSSAADDAVVFQLSEAIAITLKERDCTESLSHNGVIDSMLINRRNDDLVEKLTLYERSDLKIGIKLFINSDNEYYLSEAVTQG